MMAVEQHFKSGIFQGEDKVIRFTITDGDNVPVDVAGWTFEWIVRKSDTDTETAVLSKTTAAGIAVSGIFNVDPTLNTQRVVVTLTDTDLGIAARQYRHALKRADDGYETVLSYGDFVLAQVVAR